MDALAKRQAIFVVSVVFFLWLVLAAKSNGSGTQVLTVTTAFAVTVFAIMNRRTPKH